VLIKLDTLNKLFNGHTNGTPTWCTGTCCGCGSSLAIKMEKVAGGYGLQGGALHEIGDRQFVVRCETCHQTSSKPNDVGKSAETPVDGALMDVTFFSMLSDS